MSRREWGVDGTDRPHAAYLSQDRGDRITSRKAIHRSENPMKIHEYQAKELPAAAGAPVPRGVVVSTPQEATKAFDTLGGPVVIKAQVHAGGRGKGGFKGSGFRPGGADDKPPSIES